jgi:hypothetical protein
MDKLTDEVCARRSYPVYQRLRYPTRSRRQQSRFSIVREEIMLPITRTRDFKKFLIAATVVFVIAVSVISRVTFKGVEDQYNLPIENWSLGLFVIQGAWVFIYSIMFTIIGSLPFAFYFLGPKSNHDS